MAKKAVPETGFIMGSKLYDKLKFVALILLPAVGTLYFTLGNTWNWPHVEQVLGTITAVDTFLGAIIGISSASFNNSDAKYDGAAVVTHKPKGGKLVSLELKEDPEDIEKRESLLFKIRNETQPVTDDNY